MPSFPEDSVQKKGVYQEKEAELIGRIPLKTIQDLMKPKDGRKPTKGGNYVLSGTPTYPHHVELRKTKMLGKRRRILPKFVAILWNKFNISIILQSPGTNNRLDEILHLNGWRM